VTNREYHAFILATGREAPAHWDIMTFPPGTAEEPVTLVTWYDARDYCAWRGKRLPSQEEWQQVCQAPAFRKRGDVWEWTQSGEAEWKVLCGPQGTCACSHRYRPTWKNAVKGFRCATDQPLAGWPGRGSGTAHWDTPPAEQPPSSAAQDATLRGARYRRGTAETPVAPSQCQVSVREMLA
jgi:hypothetical protein